MKTTLYLLALSGACLLFSCENRRHDTERDGDPIHNDRNIDRGADTLDRQMDRRDTTPGTMDDRGGALNDRGVPSEGINDHNALRNMPRDAREKINRDAEEKERELVDGRAVDHGNVNHYELTFLEKDGNQIKVMYDETGEAVGD
ncbi:hypothetical protein [Negadavirga shengliensis]|uniref:PepSY domain-containing protein n=1 Tax=Negadavirga shengliensis TaxID=1389218 RepID=A0ABV9T0I7_9BACT